MSISLRPYQRAAIDALYRHLLSRDDNPAIVLPTGAGKSWIIAQIAMDVASQGSGRVLVLAHVKELLEQNADKIRRLCPNISMGIYSAGLNQRDTDSRVIVAGIQSVYKRATELGPFNFVIVDESHLIPPDGDGMYRTFLAEAKGLNPRMRVIGLTATPFRLTSGSICTPENILNHICYEVSVRDLIRDKYLCPLVTKAGEKKADVDQLHIRGGEFIANEIEDLMNQDALVASACAEIVALTCDRKSCLIFASGVKHGEHVARMIREASGRECGFICGDTPAAERNELIEKFRTGDLKYLCNVNVLTTGFDAPNIDCIAILRPTMSPGLWCQMVGRGLRLSPNKNDCLILDFGGNALRHGPIDMMRTPGGAHAGEGRQPVKECPRCRTIIAAGYSMCPECEYQFPQRERAKHDIEASKAGVLSDQYIDDEYEVLDTRYTLHIKRNAPLNAPKSMRVDYQVGAWSWISEWICLEHDGFARRKAVEWWRRHSHDPVPKTAEYAVLIANAGGLATAKKIVVRTIAGEKYPRIIKHILGSIPEPATKPIEHELDDVPF